LKSFAKEFEKFEKLEQGSGSANNGAPPKKDWKAILRILVGYKDKEGLLTQFEAALDKAIPVMELPKGTDPKLLSGLRTRLYKGACRAYVQDGAPKKGLEYCDQVLKVDPADSDALLARGEIALQEEDWESAVRAFEKAFESSGRSSQAVRATRHVFSILAIFTCFLLDPSKA